MKNIVVITSTPRKGGNSELLAEAFARGAADAGHAVETVYLRDKTINYCRGCEACYKLGRCVQKDDMAALLETLMAADVIALASPVYFSTLPGKMLSLISRMQPWHAATFFIKEPLVQRRKKSAAILTGGGKGNCANASHHLSAFFRMVNAHGFKEHIVISDKIDTIPAWEDEAAVQGVREIAEWLNRGDTP